MPCAAAWQSEPMDDKCFGFSPFLTTDLVVKTPTQAQGQLKKYCYVVTRYNAWIAANDQFAWLIEGTVYDQYIYDKNGIWIPWPNLTATCSAVGSSTWYKP